MGPGDQAGPVGHAPALARATATHAGRRAAWPRLRRPETAVPVRSGQHRDRERALVDSIPVGRAVALGASTVYVLQVGRIESPLAVPTRPWEVGLVAFEIARRHRFHEEMSSLPSDVRVHVLPTGGDRLPAGAAQFRYRDKTRVGQSIERAYVASAGYLS